MGVASGLGALFAALVLLRIPRLVSTFKKEDQANHYTSNHSLEKQDFESGLVMYITAAIIMLFAAVITALGIKSISDPFGYADSGTRDSQIQSKSSTDAHTQHTQELNNPVSTIDNLKIAVMAAIHNPALMLAYIAGFAARGDSTLLTIFLSLWAHDYALEIDHESESNATKAAGLVTGIAQTCALLFAPLSGWISSLFGPTRGLAFASLLATLAYVAMSLVEDPRSVKGIIAACFLGIGEISIIVSGQALASHEVCISSKKES